MVIILDEIIFNPTIIICKGTAHHVMMIWTPSLALHFGVIILHCEYFCLRVTVFVSVIMGYWISSPSMRLTYTYLRYLRSSITIHEAHWYIGRWANTCHTSANYKISEDHTPGRWNGVEIGLLNDDTWTNPILIQSSYPVYGIQIYCSKLTFCDKCWYST